MVEDPEIGVLYHGSESAQHANDSACTARAASTCNVEVYIDALNASNKTSTAQSLIQTVDAKRGTGSAIAVNWRSPGPGRGRL